MRRPDHVGQSGPVDLLKLEPVLVTPEHAARVGILTAVFEVARDHPAIRAAREAATTREDRALIIQAEARLAELAFRLSGIGDSL